MRAPINILEDQEIVDILICPKCGGNLHQKSKIECQNENCKGSYSVVNNVPILIDEENSLFSTADLVAAKDTTFETNRSSLKAFVRKLIPDLSLNPMTQQNFKELETEILKKKTNAVILVLGGGMIGKGMEDFMSIPQFKFIESDVYWGPRTNLMLDAHSLPFADDSVDAVIIQAVLEHVIDPYRCVQEINRVLHEGGLVYSETPFMQQVHMGKYDFTRFTHLGHRRLFRRFDEISSGPACGPAMAFAWAFKYFLSSFSKSRRISKLLGILGTLVSFWLIYLDYFLIRKPGSYDAASSYFFLGRKNSSVITDKEVLLEYKGLC